MAAIGSNEVFVLGQGVQRALINGVGEQRAVVEMERHGVARGEQGGAEGGADYPFVAYFGSEQGEVAAIGGGECALVDH